MTTRRSAFIGRCLEAAWARGRRFFKPLAENSSRRPAGTISNPALNYGPGGTTSRTTGNPCTSSSESSWGTGHAVTRRVTFPQLTLRTESCDGNGGHLLSWRTVGRRCGRHNFPSCSGGCCTKVLRPHQQVSITADNVRAPAPTAALSRLGSGEECHNDDPSRSDRVVLTDEPADEIPAPDLGDLVDRGDRGAVLRDR